MDTKSVSETVKAMIERGAVTAREAFDIAYDLGGAEAFHFASGLRGHQGMINQTLELNAKHRFEEASTKIDEIQMRPKEAQ